MFNNKGLAKIRKNPHFSIDLSPIKAYYLIVKMEKAKAAPDGGAHEPLDDPRARLLAKTIADIGVKGAYASDDAARVVLALMDGALVASQNGFGAEAPSPEAPRRAVVAAALRVSGLA